MGHKYFLLALKYFLRNNNNLGKYIVKKSLKCT